MTNTIHTTGKMQTFYDTRFGFSATLKIDLYNGYVLRVRDGYGKMFYKGTHSTANAAKLFLERLRLTESPAMSGNWYTVKGYVCDIEN